MRVKFGVLALALVCAVGCGKNDGSNTPLKANGGMNTPVVADSNNEPDTNSAPEANNSPEANNTASVPANNEAPSTVNATGKNELQKDLDKTFSKMDQAIKPIKVAATDKGALGVAQAKKLAAGVDATMKALTDTKLSFNLGATLPEGHGDVKGLDTVIADRNRFLIRYAKFLRDENPHFETYTVLKQKDGKYATLIGEKYQPGRIAPESDAITGWVTDSIHYITSGIGTDRKPLTELVNAAEKAKWKINVENQKFDMGNFQRIIMESPTLPKRRYEILVEPSKKLLVTFNADVEDKKKSRVSLSMLTMKNSKRLTDKDLKAGVNVDKITVMTPDEARKAGIKVPDPTKKD